MYLYHLYLLSKRSFGVIFRSKDLTALDRDSNSVLRMNASPRYSTLCFPV
jgi:hypothetical protein